MYPRKYLVYLGLVILGLCGAAGPAIPFPSNADLDTKAIVRLYSGEQIVGEWKASGLGRMDGTSFVFPVKHGVVNLEVRINGTFSVETTQ